MKKFNLKTLPIAISGLMSYAMLAFLSNAHASDTEIYQPSKDGNVTLTLMIDISGSMNLTYTSAEDYNLSCSNRSWDLAKQPTPIQESASSARPYARYYCKVPVDPATITTGNRGYWSDGDAIDKGSAWITDPKIGCKPFDDAGNEVDASKATHRRCFARITRIKDALYDILNGNSAQGVSPLDDKISIGFSTLGVQLRPRPSAPWSKTNYLNTSVKFYHRNLGAIRFPARPLGEEVDVGGGTKKTQRQILLDFLSDDEVFDAYTSTPTARSYAESASYMLGTSTSPTDKELYETDLVNTGTWAHRACLAWDTSGTRITHNGNSIIPCTSWNTTDTYPVPYIINDFIHLDGYDATTRLSASVISRLRMGNYSNYIYYGHKHENPTGFDFSASDAKTADGLTYKQPDTIANQAYPECSGQGIYALSDGMPSNLGAEESPMKLALGATHGASFSCGATDKDGLIQDWKCMWNMASALLDPNKNPSGKVIKTAAVGFARQYVQGGLTPYDGSKSIADNLNALKGTDGKLIPESFSANDSDEYQALVTMANFARWGIYGGGGWYAGASTQDVVGSINGFIQSLTKDIPKIATGQPFIPIDPLNRLTYMNDAYYGSFTPEVNSAKLFWKGDVNKYLVKNQLLYGQNDAKLFDATTGLINTTTLGFWDTGATEKLPLRDKNRPVFTNAGGNLVGVTVNELYNNTSGANLSGAGDAYHNAWLNLLGYNVALNTTKPAQTELASKPELRQLGALMHSTPIILTQEGRFGAKSGSTLTTTDRKDYVLYGSTQGILHVVDTTTGIEKIAFVPFEMMQNHSENFQEVGSANGGMTYGVDGQWNAYTQYVNDAGKFTVNKDSDKATSTDLSGKGVQWVYGGLRMGGRSYYALDLSDIDNPKLKFHINPDGAAAGTALSYMGQSWAKPTLGFVNWQGKRTLVMFVGGGYDDGYENPTYDQTNGKGAGVYMFDAHTGDLLWWGSKHVGTSSANATHNDHLQYSVASNISTYDRNNDGLVDNLFFGDLGGQVFRVDFDNNNSTALTSRIVRLYNGHQAGGLSPRFYEAPSFSAHSHDSYKDARTNNQFGAVSIASGNRSSPKTALGSTSASDALFVIYDFDTLAKGNATASTTPMVTDASTDALSTLTHTMISKNAGLALNDPNLDKSTMPMSDDGKYRQGWKYYLSPDESGALKGYSTPRVVSNFLFLTTYSPKFTTQQNDCSAGIVGKSYQELFCMPTGICNTEQNDIVKPEAKVDTDPTFGSPYRAIVGIGIVQTAVGNATDNTASNRVGSTGPMVDCTDPKHSTSIQCLTEVSSISNKPVRWYEDQPRN